MRFLSLPGCKEDGCQMQLRLMAEMIIRRPIDGCLDLR